MKDAEDEAFDELARKQGSWGGGFKAKRQMAADKLQDGKCKYCVDGCIACDALAQPPLPAQRPWVGLTEEDFSSINQSCLTKLQAATSAESILKKKNT